MYGGIKIEFALRAGYESMYVDLGISLITGAFEGPLTVKFLTPKAPD